MAPYCDFLRCLERGRFIMSGIKLLDDRQTAAILRRSPRTLARWRAEGTGPRYINIRGRPCYRGVDIDAWLETLVVEPVRGRGTA